MSERLSARQYRCNLDKNREKLLSSGLARCGRPFKPEEVALLLGITKPQATHFLGKMVQDMLLEPCRDPDDNNGAKLYRVRARGILSDAWVTCESPTQYTPKWY